MSKPDELWRHQVIALANQLISISQDPNLSTDEIHSKGIAVYNEIIRVLDWHLHTEDAAALTDHLLLSAGIHQAQVDDGRVIEYINGGWSIRESADQ